jgi:hypothetical protein
MDAHKEISTGDLLLRIAEDKSLAKDVASFVQVYDDGGWPFEFISDFCILASARRKVGTAPDVDDVRRLVDTKAEEFDIELQWARDYHRLYPALFAASEEEKDAETEEPGRAA